MANTGYLIYNKLKKVSNDGKNTPLDINNIPTSISGLPQHVVLNDGIITDIQKEENEGSCPLPTYVTITCISSPTIGGTTTINNKDSDVVIKGSSVIIIANPKLGYKFVRWSDGDTSPTRNIIATNDITYIAVYQELVNSISINGEQVINKTYSSNNQTDTSFVIYSSDVWESTSLYNDVNNWFTVTPNTAIGGNTSITITLQSNTSLFKRNGKITFYLKDNPSIVAVLNIKQEISTNLAISPEYLLLDWQQHQEVLTINSSTDWTIDTFTIPSWITFVKYNGTSDDIYNTIIVKQNDSDVTRTCQIKFTNTEGLSKIIEISQSNRNLIVNPGLLNFTSDGGTLNLDITSNGGWEIIDGNVPFYTFSKNNNNLNSNIQESVSITVSPNVLQTARTVNLLIRLISKPSIFKQITIIQSAATPVERFILVNEVTNDIVRHISNEISGSAILRFNGPTPIKVSVDTDSYSLSSLLTNVTITPLTDTTARVDYTLSNSAPNKVRYGKLLFTFPDEVVSRAQLTVFQSETGFVIKDLPDYEWFWNGSSKMYELEELRTAKIGGHISLPISTSGPDILTVWKSGASAQTDIKNLSLNKLSDNEYLLEFDLLANNLSFDKYFFLSFIFPGEHTAKFVIPLKQLA